MSHRLAGGLVRRVLPLVLRSAAVRYSRVAAYPPNNASVKLVAFNAAWTTIDGMIRCVR